MTKQSVGPWEFNTGTIRGKAFIIDHVLNITISVCTKLVGRKTLINLQQLDLQISSLDTPKHSLYSYNNLKAAQNKKCAFVSIYV